MRGGGGGTATKWQVASGGSGGCHAAALLLPCCRAGSGGYASTTTDICFSFSSALRKPFGSSLCFLREAKRAEKQREREIKKILKYATKARWNFKLSRGLLIRPSGVGGGTRHKLFPPSLLRIIKRSTVRGKKLQARTAKLHANKLALHTLTLPLHPIMLHSVGS